MAEVAIPPAFQDYFYNGLELILTYSATLQDDEALRDRLFQIVQQNMATSYESAGGVWAWSDDRKRRELCNPAAEFIVARDFRCGDIEGFAHLRFVHEGDMDVLYVYELQLTPSVRAKGLGTFIMRLIEWIARQECVSAVRLTCLSRNVRALNFYRRMAYSKVPDTAYDSYEELEKVVNIGIG